MDLEINKTKYTVIDFQHHSTNTLVLRAPQK